MAVVTLLLEAINRERVAHHLAPLVLSARQSVCSRRHSAHMASVGFISHDQFPADVCIPYTHTGENVGEDQADPGSAVLTLNRLMVGEGPCPTVPCVGPAFEAHGHYMNLLNPAYTHVGIGIVLRNGVTWLTEDFT
jgi:uncharacterized protein YkwD